MRILGKSDQDNAILFKELSKLLESYDVPFETMEQEPEPVDDSPPLMRKLTRRDTIISRVIMSKNLESAYNKITVHIAHYQSDIESLMDIFRARSHKQSIKSSSRQSETQVIQKDDFFQILTCELPQNGAQIEFSPEEMSEIENCVQLTPKIPTMYAVRHIETLLAAIL